MSGHAAFPQIEAAFRDRDGRIWGEVREPFVQGQPTVRTLWTGDGRGPLTRYMTLPPDMDLVVYGGRAAVDMNMYAFDSSDYILLDPAKPPLLKRK